MNRLAVLSALCVLSAAPALAQSVSPAIKAAVADPGRPATDTVRDADRKPAESVAFSGIKPGDKVADFLPGGGYFTRIFSKAVGPNGMSMPSCRPSSLTDATAPARKSPRFCRLIPTPAWW